jgi:hypothetical protein
MIDVAVWLMLLLLSLASAFRYRSISFAPVRGSSHFLCRRKESNQRKRLTPIRLTNT